MCFLVTTIAVESLAELKTRARRAWADDTDAVEIRLDTFDDDPGELAAFLRASTDGTARKGLKARGSTGKMPAAQRVLSDALKECPERTWIVTCRSADEGGHFYGDTADRVSLLIAAARGSDAFVDFELADWRRSKNVQQKVRLASARSDGEGHRLILSAHDFAAPPADLTAIVEEMFAESPGCVAKVAYRARDICDSFAALDLMRRHKDTVTAIAMGEDGSWSRVLAKKLGAFATYCTLDAGSAVAPGQLTLEEMVQRYRWPELGESTRVFGVLGDPIAHSMSPALFNSWFAEAGMDAVYLPLLVRRTGGCLERFLDGCLERPWLDIGGFSVTLPHKSAALAWVKGGADPAAAAVGALNTLAFRYGEVEGFNTDCQAAVESMVSALGCMRDDLRGVPVDVLGTGGAARAVLAGLRDVGCDVTVFGRSPRKAGKIASDFDCRPAAWEERVDRSGEVLVNCTNVGMWPTVDATPMPPEALPGCRLVFDVIYNPLETLLLRDAAEAGAATLGGLDMFVRQAAKQFELWTSRTPDTQRALETVADEIRRRSGRKP